MKFYLKENTNLINNIFERLIVISSSEENKELYIMLLYKDNIILFDKVYNFIKFLENNNIHTPYTLVKKSHFSNFYYYVNNDIRSKLFEINIDMILDNIKFTS